MRRIRFVLAAAVLVVLVAGMAVGPALAQNFRFNDNGRNHDRGFFSNNNGSVDFETEQEIEDTGNVTLNTNVTSSGNNSNQCVAPLQFGNTGNLQNFQGFLQYNSTADDIEFEGSSFEFSPSLTNTCDQAVQQAAAAG
jgi:hypothetical protein